MIAGFFGYPLGQTGRDEETARDEDLLTSMIMTQPPLDNHSVKNIPAGLPRVVEVLIALAGLIIAGPLTILLALATRISSRGPVIFRQIRVGQRGRSFTLYKLRTMTASSSGPQVTSRDDPRITKLGAFLRKTKLDELPEFWNVLRGDMSLVGPRPEVPRYVDLGNPAWQLTLSVRPGITDPVTMQLRDEEALLSKVAGDREAYYINQLQPLKLRGYQAYLTRRSWRTDLRVLIATAMVVLFPRKLPPVRSSDFVVDAFDSVVDGKERA